MGKNVRLSCLRGVSLTLDPISSGGGEEIDMYTQSSASLLDFPNIIYTYWICVPACTSFFMGDDLSLCPQVILSTRKCHLWLTALFVVFMKHSTKALCLSLWTWL